ncbi:transmembrane protein 177-like [Conger conger]|uniref:transmembrane protein 177-like n=1 Tax=Conger conger TaxID=82655 RepID=UPI002A59DF32|nr:transmembrane protein 177-like [Conger conger]XP_061081508.1 transmembrane protein 177-like [Conger conger]XP_061081509.1 transmembrane protein 177-like [Conger conger]XP_061081510.1 transmembrane protein 177-like [Conger conger]XP_061081511.1 transmembrane protein 177-like [Conger conger]XP_061081513.1 transmembrane protein 177-like [Conger conger]XP_061081514.1 transmembrane protein 177-like [Conger conger]XP_061081515.1 transmembrane protein 177-like [Conger conger]
MSFPFRKITALVKKYRAGLLIAGCGAAFSVNILYHVFPDNAFKKVYQAWSKGEPSDLSEKLEKTFQEVLTDLGVSSPKKYSAFAAFGFQPVGAGVPWMPSGARIGIPANFNSTLDDSTGITNRVILINGKEVDWDSSSGTVLKDALLFSPQAQKFAVAREVARLDSGGPVLHATVAPACLAGVCVYSVALKQIFGLYSGPALKRGAVNVFALALGAVSYLLTSDAVCHWMDYKSDRTAASVSQDYAKGGVEFYDKILSRNKTLRTLMGQKGGETYAPSGNLFPSSMFRMKHASYTSRREGVASLLKLDKA